MPREHAAILPLLRPDEEGYALARLPHRFRKRMRFERGHALQAALVECPVLLARSAKNFFRRGCQRALHGLHAGRICFCAHHEHAAFALESDAQRVFQRFHMSASRESNHHIAARAAGIIVVVRRAGGYDD